MTLAMFSTENLARNIAPNKGQLLLLAKLGILD